MPVLDRTPPIQPRYPNSTFEEGPGQSQVNDINHSRANRVPSAPQHHSQLLFVGATISSWTPHLQLVSVCRALHPVASSYGLDQLEGQRRGQEHDDQCRVSHGESVDGTERCKARSRAAVFAEWWVCREGTGLGRGARCYCGVVSELGGRRLEDNKSLLFLSIVLDIHAFLDAISIQYAIIAASETLKLTYLYDVLEMRICVRKVTRVYQHPFCRLPVLLIALSIMRSQHRAVQ